jgi:putative membrane protein
MRRNRMSRVWLIAAGALLIPGGVGFAQAMGQPGQATPAGGAARPNATGGYDDPMNSRPNEQGQAMGQASQEMMDKKFVAGALEGGMAEVALGKLALEKSSNAEVKEFAQQMVDDHTKLGEQMKPVAEQIGVKMPTELSKKDKSTEAKLSSLSGQQFDKAYIETMVKDHQKDYSEFQSEAKSAVIPSVKQAAAAGEPVIKSHLDHIQQIAKSATVANNAQ